MNELRTRELLTRMANDPAPPTTVDVDRAIVTARHQRRRTQWAVVGAAAAVVLIVTLGVMTAFKPDDQAQPAPFVSAGTPSAPAPKFGVAPQYFDPMNPRLEVGHVPDGLTEGLWNAAVTAEFRTYGGKAGTAMTVYAIPRKGGFPATEYFGAPLDGPDINGQPSKWYQLPVPAAPSTATRPGDPPPAATAKPTRALKNAGVLRWEYGKGGSVQVELTNVKDPMKVAAEVARSVRLDRPKPFRAPYEMSKPKIPVVRTAGGGGANQVIEFASAGWRRPSAIVGVGETRAPKYVPKPNATVNGREIHEELVDSITMIEFPFGPGAEFSIQCGAADDTEPAKAANRAECRRVALSAKQVGTLDDPSSWSSSVLR
ncbi:hypothetical protein [Cryptosporangium japonicum]|uniref:LigA protein n=1 Tax=Cryptosporangium japonicum TaxID=80872 RepID=A0ABN0TLX9_9ACTN